MKRILLFLAALAWLMAGATGVSAIEANADPQKPITCEVVTGNLLKSDSPQPDSGKETATPSGWEVDKSGGDIEYNPTCGFPQESAVHGDCFKLVDTSASAAVTLKHQIARQTDGTLTMEFRFKLSKLMDGASWQLRDFGQAGVSLVTQGGNLCWESGEVITAIEPNHAYSVKVVADLSAKKADVYVDGKLKAKGLAFIRPIQSVDCFLARTGETDMATGDLFLDSVNIYKGSPADKGSPGLAELQLYHAE